MMAGIIGFILGTVTMLLLIAFAQASKRDEDEK